MGVVCGGSGATPEWAAQKCALGIDEAGRGPVVGSMVYACAITTVAALKGLKDKKFADSKTLTEEQRESLFEGISADDTIAHSVESISAKDISHQMLSRTKVSLNVMAETATCQLIEGASLAGYNLTEIYVDTVGDAGRYSARLSAKFPGIKFTVCPKADSLYPIVSAASIVAKVTRDREIHSFQAALVQQAANAASTSGSSGATDAPAPALQPLGSGYPSDPTTKAWLRANIDPVFGYPDIVRFSWETCNRLLDDEAVAVGWETEGEEGGAGGTHSLFNFMAGGASTGAESSGADRHSFFRVRRLQPVYAAVEAGKGVQAGGNGLGDPAAGGSPQPRVTRRSSMRGKAVGV